MTVQVFTRLEAQLDEARAAFEAATEREEVARREAELETLNTELHRRKSRHASLLEIQQRWSGLPTPHTLVAETFKSREGWHLFVYPFAGRQVRNN